MRHTSRVPPEPVRKADLRALAEQACERYSLSAEARAVAWSQCFIDFHESPSQLRMSAVACYMAIAASLRPHLPSGRLAAARQPSRSTP